MERRNRTSFLLSFIRQRSMTWIDEARRIHKIHIDGLRENINWTINDTSNKCHRSLGSTSQYLLIASWLKTHENQIRRLSSMNEALSFIREKKRELQLSGLD